MTGCNPGKHGVSDFIRPTGDGFGLVNSTSIRQPTIWQLLSESGIKVGAMNVPVTYSLSRASAPALMISHPRLWP